VEAVDNLMAALLDLVVMGEVVLVTDKIMVPAIQVAAEVVTALVELLEQVVQV
jgi:hypothetical protein